MATLSVTHAPHGGYTVRRVHAHGGSEIVGAGLTHAETMDVITRAYDDGTTVVLWPREERRTHRALIVRVLVVAVTIALILLLWAFYARMVQNANIAVWELWQQGVAP